MDKLVEKFLGILQLDHLPTWLKWLLGGFLVLWLLSRAIGDIAKSWKDDILPRFYNQEKRQHVKNRRKFAAHIQQQLVQLDIYEDWSDYRFAELEAEVEVDERQFRRNFANIFLHRYEAVRREHSLSHALYSSASQHILVVGEPGSGKSVALRHVARKLAAQAEKNRKLKNLIPVYINLKGLQRGPDEEINRAFISHYILQSLNKVNDREVDKFLEDEFERGLQEGSWLFLFDSFDETPEILGSIEADQIIDKYAAAISDFAGGMNQCRVIVASRHFNGPNFASWSRFRLLQLSEQRRGNLIKKTEMLPKDKKLLIDGLNAYNAFHNFSGNPLFLSLLCEYMSTKHSFPKSAHIVFEEYVEARLSRDKEKICSRYGLEAIEVRKVAEQAAFCMNAEDGLGLIPTRNELQIAMIRQGFTVDERFDKCLDALEYIKIARYQPMLANELNRFTFSHRRFQEYFATCVALHEPHKVTEKQLLADARWRETAVVMCQMQPVGELDAFLKEAKRMLSIQLSDLVDLDRILPQPDEAKAKGEGKQTPPSFFWPPHAAHVLAILQEGFVNHVDEVPMDFKMVVENIVLTAYTSGTLLDKKVSLEVAGPIRQEKLLLLLQNAFMSKSQWLMEVAYRQVASLKHLPKVTAESIREVLVRLAISGRLNQQSQATYAYLSRIDEAPKLLLTARLLVSLPLLDCSLLIFCFALMWLSAWGRTIPTDYRQLVSLSILFHFLLVVRATNSKNRIGVGRFGQRLYDNIVATCFARLIFPIGFLGPSDFAMNMPMAVWLLYCYYALWLPSSLLAALRGDFVHPIWWPFMPITPGIRVMISGLVFATSKNSYIKVFQVSKVVFVQLALAVGGLSCVVGVIWFASSLAIRLHVPSVVGTIFSYILFGLMTIVLLLIPIAFCSNLLEKYQDYRCWQKWLRTKSAVSDLQSFKKIMSLFRTSEYTLLFIQYLNQNEQMEATAETCGFLAKFGFVLRYIEENRNELSRLDSDLLVKVESLFSSTDAFHSWMVDYTTNNPYRMLLLPPEVADEAYKLLEALNKKKMDAGDKAAELTSD